MPVHIQELVIRAQIGQDNKGGTGKLVMDEKQRQQLVEQCVEQVIEILRTEKER